MVSRPVMARAIISDDISAPRAPAQRSIAATPLAISQCGASPSARQRRLRSNGWAHLATADPGRRHARCAAKRTAGSMLQTPLWTAGPQTGHSGLSIFYGCCCRGWPAARGPAATGHRSADGHQPIKMERLPQRPAQSLAHEENVFKSGASDVRWISIFPTEYLNFTRDEKLRIFF